ncbi:MAG: flagellar hook protein FlgE [Alphaproteobacteria bacterium]|nr:flagellar hook protein FlgE [Alphaproteobacteria bacterium]
MSIFGAMRSGVTGLFSQSQALGMIADNIANVNTVGFKAVRPRFSTLVTAQASADLHSPGGVQSKVEREIDAQGLLTSSAVSTDIAISGSGFFTVNDQTDGTGNTFFTRAGEFRPDKEGNLVNSGGFTLMGWPIDSNGTVQQTNVLSAFSVLNTANLTSAPVSTSLIEIGANLPAAATSGDANSLTAQVFDLQGGQHSLTLTYTKTATTNEWDITASITNAGIVDPDSNNDGTNDPLTTTGAFAANGIRLGTMTFSNDGTLSSITSNSATGTDVGVVNATTNRFELTFDFDSTTTSTSDRVTVALDFGTPSQADGFTQFQGNFTPNFIEQNGKQFGSLSAVNIDDAGITTALFDNGETRDIFQVPVVTFNNPNGMQERTGNVYVETTDSGPAVALEPGRGGAGSIAPSALEQSTVDLADEFTRMIVTQRAFSASTRIITTADEMLEELTRIVR